MSGLLTITRTAFEVIFSVWAEHALRLEELFEASGDLFLISWCVGSVLNLHCSYWNCWKWLVWSWDQNLMRSSGKGRPGMMPSLANLFCYLDCVWTLRYFEKYKNKNAVWHHGIITTLPHFFEICLLLREILFLYDLLTCPFIKKICFFMIFWLALLSELVLVVLNRCLQLMVHLGGTNILVGLMVSGSAWPFSLSENCELEIIKMDARFLFFSNPTNILNISGRMWN